MPSIFSKIVDKSIEANIIAETEDFIAFLDVNPLVMGHVLCVPKKEVDYIFDIEDSQLEGLIVFAKKVAKAIKLTVNCKRIGIAVIGLEVPHAHIHLVPLQTIEDINFTNKKLNPTKEELIRICEKIKVNFEY